jgi:hypothetical protein
MSEIQNKESLSSFMKKQINEKSIKKTAAKKPNSQILSKDEAEQQEENSHEIEMSDEEKLAKLKKESLSKTSDYNQSAMVRRLLLESIVKYTVMITVFVVLVIGIIEISPAIFSFLHQLVAEILLGDLSK